MSKIKLLICVVMTFVLCIMTLGYAALQERIDLEVEASIDSTYRVEITSVAQGTASGDARSTAAPQYNGLNANFYVGLTNTTDIITYNIEITNYSTVDVKLNELSITVDGSNYIKAFKLGISNGDIMLAGSTKNITLKVKYDGEAQSSEQTGTVTVNFNFTRLKGGVGAVTPEVYPAYEIGDMVSFAGSNWYVIEDSGTNKDYVTLMKETVLTNAELGEYAATPTANAMAYYYSETCHFGNTYGYSSRVKTGCAGHAFYDRSSIKLAVESYMMAKEIESSLKTVDSYKIRLIALDELVNNLGWTSGAVTSATLEGNNVPTWVYGNSVGHYWVMYSVDDSTSGSYYIHRTGGMAVANVDNAYGVRPVINLYKDAIE